MEPLKSRSNNENASPKETFMLELARDIIGTQPILTAFLAIGLGYLVGQISVGGFSLGVGAVLFVGLALGAFAPKAQITGPIGLTGLIMFLYGIGILYGRQFFEGMRGVGRKYNLLALIACVAGLFVALGLGQAFGIKIGHTLGIYAGSMTSTATLQAALDVMKSKEPSIGYSIAYPFGVIGPILCIYFMTRVVKPKFPPKTQHFHMGELTISENFNGRTLDDARNELPDGVQVTMIRKDGQNIVPVGSTLLSAGDGLLIMGDREDAIMAAAQRFGRLTPGYIVSDRADLDYIRVFVGKSNVVGVPLSQLQLPSGFPTHVLHVRRYDTDLVPNSDLMLEFGDRIGVLMPPGRKDDVRRFFGDTVKATAEFSYVSLGLGMVLGVLLGRRHRDARNPRRAVDRRAHPRTAAPDGPAAVDDAAAGQPRAAQLWSRAVSRHRRCQRGPAFRAYSRRLRIYDAVHRHGGAVDDRRYRAARRSLPDADPV
jgi:putative transport protein